jgi:hypothetical protein
VALAPAGGAAPAGGYDNLRAAAVARCDAIDPAAYQSGLYFNPDGYRSYYMRSQCLQDAAVQFRDERLCARVRQRRSMFASNWGYSPSNCRDLVRKGAAADRGALEEMKRRYVQGAMRWVDFRIERNGNGRDFDIIPSFAGIYAHGYRLTFEIAAAEPRLAPVIIHADGYYLDANNNLRLFVRQAEIRQRMPDFALGRPYTVRASATLDVGSGGSSGYWSNAFIDQVFPIAERTQTITKQVVF